MQEQAALRSLQATAEGRLVGFRRPILNVVRQALYRLGAIKLASVGRKNFILTFHSIAPDEAAEFHEMLRYLSRTFAFVSLDEMVARVAAGRAFDDAALALTFDDGLRNQKTVVYPLLRDLGLPATFYVCPGLVGAGMIWTWELECRLPWLDATRRRALLEGAGLAADADPHAFVQYLKGVPVDRREAIAEEVRAATPDFALDDRQRTLYELMDWDELLQLDPRLVTIGSHSLTHPDLHRVDGERLAREIGGSREALERRLGRPVEHFCYPNGNYDDRAVAEVSTKYRSAVTTRPGRLRGGDNPWTLNRVEFGVDPVWATWLLALRT